MSQLAISSDPYNSYDELLYNSEPIEAAHPDHMAVVATLLGLRPVGVNRCRILELGCASGDNLIPLAYAYPESTFLGIDLSPMQINEGHENIRALKLDNIKLRAMSILDVDDQFGTFDFIICHGVYSWVPKAVQDKILEIYSRHLAPQGIGYLSYNILPGWHMKGIVRSMMQLYDRRWYRDRPAEERVGKGRALLDSVAGAFPQSFTPFPVHMRSMRDELKAFPDTYVFHEYLEEYNEPIYFLEFCDRLAANGLRYLSESPFYTMGANFKLPPDVSDQLQKMVPDLLDKEQHIDLLTNNHFRRSLICHAGMQPDYQVKADRVASFQIAFLKNADQKKDYRQNQWEMIAQKPTVKAALAYLEEVWPKPVTFKDLLALARSRLANHSSGDPADDAEDLSNALLTAYATTNQLYLWLHSPAFSTRVSARPVVSQLARVQGAGAIRVPAAGIIKVTNLIHQSISFNHPLGLELLQLLDGTRDREKLLKTLFKAIKNGGISIPPPGYTITTDAQLRDFLAQFIYSSLQHFANSALLVS